MEHTIRVIASLFIDEDEMFLSRPVGDLIGWYLDTQMF